MSNPSDDQNNQTNNEQDLPKYPSDNEYEGSILRFFSTVKYGRRVATTDHKRFTNSCKMIAGIGADAVVVSGFIIYGLLSFSPRSGRFMAMHNLIHNA